MSAAQRHGHGPDDWDARYLEEDRIWSGNPNQALVDEVSNLIPGTALDVGCGEGADALWLARQGWDVTAIDPSSVAIARARATDPEINWIHAGLENADLEPGSFDLVSGFYMALPKATVPAGRLLGLVKPGGTLLVVHHAAFDRHRAQEHGFDPADFLSIDDIAAELNESWRIEVREERDRHVEGGGGAHHTSDVVLRAVKKL